MNRDGNLATIPRRLLCAAGMLALLLAGAATVSKGRDVPRERWHVKVTAFDEIVLPGETVTLRAKLDHVAPWGLHVPLRRHRLRFSSRSLSDQEARTAEEGAATISVKVQGDGGTVCPVKVRFPGSGHHLPAEGNSNVFLWSKDSPVLITDVDNTISDLGELKVPYTSVRKTPPMPGAVESLTALSRLYRIVYLTARDEVLYAKTRAWLDAKGFPEGPLFCRDFYIGSRQEAFKQRFIADLKARFPRVVVGVGDRSSDAGAYLKNGLKTFLIDPDGKGHFAKGAIVVKSWEEVRKQLTRTAAKP